MPDRKLNESELNECVLNESKLNKQFIAYKEEKKARHQLWLANRQHLRGNNCVYSLCAQLRKIKEDEQVRFTAWVAQIAKPELLSRGRRADIETLAQLNAWSLHALVTEARRYNLLHQREVPVTQPRFFKDLQDDIKIMFNDPSLTRLFFNGHPGLMLPPKDAIENIQKRTQSVVTQLEKLNFFSEAKSNVISNQKKVLRKLNAQGRLFLLPPAQQPTQQQAASSKVYP